MRATAYILLLLAGQALAQGTLEVIQLRHATAEQVLPALRPLLEPGGVLTGQRNQLIVRTSPRNLEELRRALAAIDAPARRLEILVRFDSAGATERSALGVEADLSRQSSRVVVRAGEARASAGERVDQRLQVLEGGRAYIAAGSSFPLRHRDGVEYREATTGVEVIPRLAGSMVILEVAPKRQSPGAIPGSVDSVGAASTVRARLGEWVELAGIDSGEARDDRGLAAGARRQGTGSRRIWVRVDEVGP
jgi:hypothetical protein